MTKIKMTKALFLLFLSFEVTFVTINIVNIENITINTYVTNYYQEN